MIWKLLLAHVLTDFLFQSNEMATGKLKFKNNLYHCLILLAISSVLLMNSLPVKTIFMLLLISIFHGIIDFGKAKIDVKISGQLNWFLFSLDQLLHILSILLILSLFFPTCVETSILKFTGILNSINFFKIAVFFFVISFGGSYFTASVCKGFNPSEKSDNSLERAGRYIGILERIIVSASILIGRFEIIGFLIAAKSIIRHQEKNEKAFAEYFLIGTFTSFIWAALFTFLYLKL